MSDAYIVLVNMNEFVQFTVADLGFFLEGVTLGTLLSLSCSPSPPLASPPLLSHPSLSPPILPLSSHPFPPYPSLPPSLRSRPLKSS